MVRIISLLLISSLSILLLSNYFFVEPLIKKEAKAFVNPRYESLPALFNSGDSLNVHLHYQNLSNHFDKPLFQDLPTGLAYRDDEAINHYYYYYYTRSNDSKIADIGHLALTIINSRNNKVNFAQENIDKIVDISIPYYAQENAYLELRYRNMPQAEKGFQKAISDLPNSEFAQTGYIKTLYYNRKFNGLSNYLSDKTIKYYPDYVLSDTYFYSGNLISYYKQSLAIFDGSWIQLFAALLVAATWLIYLYKINIFAPFSTIICLVTFPLALLATLSCWIPYQIFDVFLDFKIRQSLGNDFLYSIFGIGFIEESIKLIPVLIVLYFFRKKITEPYHYLMIASISAIGFSLFENVMYFKLYPTQIIYLRAMISVPLHIFCTTIIVYGATIVSYGKRNVNIKYGALCFLVSITVHGLFDVVLINDELNDFHLFSFVPLIGGIYALNRIYNYALNISPNFVENRTVDNKKIQYYLLTAFTGIILFEFLLGSLINGFHESYDLLIVSMAGFILLLIYISSGLSNFIIIYHYRTGILDQLKKFRYPNLLNNKVRITLLNKNQLTSTTIDLFTSFRIKVKDEITFIVSKTEENNSYQGFSNLLLVPYGYSESKSKASYSCRLYGVEEDVERIYPDTSKLKLLGNYEAVIPGKEKPPLKKFGDHINTLGFICIWLFVLCSLVYYMEYRSARQAYRWALSFLEKKDLYKASNNMKYALQKDSDFSEAYLLSAKIALYLDLDDVCLDNCNLVTAKNSSQALTLNYLTAKCNYKIKNYETAESYFDKIQNEVLTKDSVVFYKSKLLIRKKEFTKAYELLEKTFPSTKNDSINLMKLKYLIETENYPKAKQILTNDLTKSGSNLSTYYYYSGFVALGMSDTTKACEYFTESEKLKHPHAQVVWGIHCYSRVQSGTDSLIVQP